MATDAPTRERGVVSNTQTIDGPYGSSLADETELNCRWANPQERAQICQDMLRDSQLAALRAAVFLPLMRRKTMVDPNGADDRVVQHVADDLGLPVVGEDAKPVKVSTKRFSWKRHLEHVLRAPFFGHYLFSQWAPISDADGLAHLRKLLPLPPRTIQEIKVADDGGLEWVRQWVGRNTGNHFGLPDPIPVSALVAYVWEQEAGNWWGESMLRAVYWDYKAKDDLVRGNLTKMRRNGMGIPTAESTSPEGDVNLAKAHAIAAAWRSGEEAAAGTPYGTRIVLKGVEGTIPDHVPSIRLHDEAMARRFLAMVLQLGQTEHGSRALGEDFVDLLAIFQDHAAEWVCDTTTLHVVRDLVDWNYGEDAQCPLVVSARDEDPELSIEDMTALVDAGLLTVDPEMEEYLRGRYRLPEREAAELRAAATRAAGRRAPRRGVLTAAAGSETSDVEDIPLSRDPTEDEQHVDWQLIGATWLAARVALVDRWRPVRRAQIADLVAQIRQAGTLDDLLRLSAVADGQDRISAALDDLARFGADQAVLEAAAQGTTIAAPDLTVLEQNLATRASVVADQLARALEEAAAREAVRNFGGVLTPDDVADLVDEHLTALTDAFLEEQLGGALTGALNQGRFLAFESYPAGTRFLGSAVLDTATCNPCRGDDGREFDDLDDMRRTYPVAGNVDCEGRLRCRCTGVAVAPIEQPASVA